MISIDNSLFIQIANFLFMMIVLNILVYRPLRHIIQQRKDKFAGYESDISRLGGAVNEKMAEVERRLTEARREGFRRKDEMKGLGLEAEKEILSQASVEADQYISRIKDQIGGEIVAARQALQADLAVFSAELAQKVLGRSVS